MKIAIFKFASCSGCQLELLNLEEELLEIAGKVEIAYFVEASRKLMKGPYDISLVEGSVSTPEQLEELHKIREESKYLIAIGSCATAGGIQALRNWAQLEEYKKIVYLNPEWIKTLEKSTPLSEHVKVDFEIRGCPINRKQLLWVLSQIIVGREPFLPTHSLCIQCKIKGYTCVLVTRGEPCLGPVVMAGCGALCPSFQRPCYACYGPSDLPQTIKLAQQFTEKGLSKKDISLLFKKCESWTPKFKEVVEKYE
ncbi:MAG: oxidoreductase [archaeon GBS-70-058]|nr:oxidoreductase [Candidatus Culexarchaeum nevadense]